METVRWYSEKAKESKVMMKFKPLKSHKSYQGWLVSQPFGILCMIRWDLDLFQLAFRDLHLCLLESQERYQYLHTSWCHIWLWVGLTRSQASVSPRNQRKLIKRNKSNLNQLSWLRKETITWVSATKKIIFNSLRVRTILSIERQSRIWSISQISPLQHLAPRVRQTMTMMMTTRTTAQKSRATSSAARAPQAHHHQTQTHRVTLCTTQTLSKTTRLHFHSKTTTAWT